MKKPVNLAFYLVTFLYVISRVLFNEEGNVSGAFKSNTLLYINSFVSSLTLLLIFSLKKNKRLYPNYGLYTISFFYYIFSMVSTVYSDIPIITLYNSFLGIMFVISSLVISECILMDSTKINKQFTHLINLMGIFSLIGVCSNIYFFLKILKIKNIYTYGVPSGFIAAFVLYISFILYDYKSSFLKKTISLFLFIFTLFLKSFSAYLAFFIMILFYFLLKRKYILFSILLTTVFLSYFAFIEYLELNSTQLVLNKQAGTYLTGSGRFELYSVALDVYLNDFNIINKIFGVGFMAERHVLLGHDLTWLTDPHNSIILNLLGLGVIGFIFYCFFIVYPFIFYSNVKKYKELKVISLYWLLFHIMAVSYGVTTSYYLGRPSFLLIFSLIFYNIIYINFKKHKQLTN